MSNTSDMIQPSDPPKNAILALILSLLFGGVGQLYLGQTTKGIILTVVWFLGWCTFGVVSFVASIVGAIDAYMIADKLQKGEAVGQMQWFWDK